MSALQYMAKQHVLYIAGNEIRKDTIKAQK